MYRSSILALCCIIGLSLGRQPEAPHHSTDHLPDTAFSCRDKVLGGYYADPDAQCQMFHVCVKVAGVGIQDFRFLCPNGTAFDQEAQICASWADVACEPTALYYSSDNFDLYRIGSGFESKKAPHISEEEQDFHLQRAEPDILSGAHSSNFFNNREGKDIDDPRPSVPNRNHFEQQPKRKVVKKLQRRPVETTTQYTTTTTTTTTQRQFTNNFAGSYAPTTSRSASPFVSPFASSSFVPPQSTANNPTYFTQTKQTNTPSRPTQPPVEYKTENVNFNDNRVVKQRPTGFESNANAGISNVYNNRQNNNYDSNKNSERTRQNHRRVIPNRQNVDNNNYSSTSKPIQTTERTQVNRGRGQLTYHNIRTTARPTITTISQSRQSESQTSQFTNTNNYKTSQQYNQQSTQGSSTYRNENDQQTTYKIKYTPQASTQSTPQFNQQYENRQSYQTNSDHSDKKATNKLNEKKQHPSQVKSANAGFDNHSKNQQTPAPKFNTNLLYDNNQQSTPDYYSSQQNQQNKISNKPQLTNGPEYNQTPRKQSTTFEQQPTIQPSTYNPGKNNYFNQPSYDKTKLQQYSTVRPSPSPSVSPNQNYVQRSSTISYKNPEYDDGQYRPEFYEREAGGEYDISSKLSNDNNNDHIYNKNNQNYNHNNQNYKNNNQNYNNNNNNQNYNNNNQNYNNNNKSNKRPYVEQNDALEQEFLKTAHSINIAASNNKLARENQQRFNAITQTTSRAQTNDFRDNKNKNYSPSSTTVSKGSSYENQFQSNNTPTSTSAPVKQHYDEQRSNYYSQSTASPQQITKVNPTISSSAASFNNPQFNARNIQQNNYYTPSSTSAPPKQYYDNTQSINQAFSVNTKQSTVDVTTHQPPKTQYTTASPRSVYSSFAAVTSEAPRPFSLRTDSPPPSPSKKQVISKTSASSLAKPVANKKKEDVSYDYAYYDTADHNYSEYENIEEFGRTSKKQ